MLSNRIILLFLGIIFLIIIVLSSGKLSQGIKSKISGIFPGVKPVPTVNLGDITPTLTPSPTVAHFNTAQAVKGTRTINSKNPTQTPDTGAGTLSLFILSALASTGLIIKRLSKVN